MTGVAKWFATTHSHSHHHAPSDRRPPTPPPPLPLPSDFGPIDKGDRRTRRWSWRHSTAATKADEVTRSLSASNLLSLSSPSPAAPPTPSHDPNVSTLGSGPGLTANHNSQPNPLTSVSPNAGAPPSSFAFSPRTPKRRLPRLHIGTTSETQAPTLPTSSTYPSLTSPPPSPHASPLPDAGMHSAPRPTRKTSHHHLPRALSQQQLGSVRRRRAPSSASPQQPGLAPQHPNGQTRFKPGTRPTWRFLKNLRSPVHLPAPTSANGKAKTPSKKEAKCKDKVSKPSKGSKDKEEEEGNKSLPTSRRSSPRLVPARALPPEHPPPDGAITTDWETDDGHAGEERKPRRSFSLKIRAGRKKTSAPAEGTMSPPPSPTPSRSASPTRTLKMGTFGLGRPKRRSEPIRSRAASPGPPPPPGISVANRLPSSGTLMTFATASSSPSSVDSSVPSSNPLSMHTLSRPTSPVSSPLSCVPLATTALGAAAGHGQGQTLARIDSVSPRRRSAPAEAGHGETPKQGKRASNTQNMVLSIALGCAIALSPRLAVAATLVVLVAAMCLAALVRVLALPRVWVEAEPAATHPHKRTTSGVGVKATRQGQS